LLFVRILISFPNKINRISTTVYIQDRHNSSPRVNGVKGYVHVNEVSNGYLEGSETSNKEAFHMQTKTKLPGQQPNKGTFCS